MIRIIKKLTDWLESSNHSLHILLSFIMTITLLSLVGGGFQNMVAISVLIFLLGISKELADYLDGGDFDKQDLLADAIGIAFALQQYISLTHMVY